MNLLRACFACILVIVCTACEVKEPIDDLQLLALAEISADETLLAEGTFLARVLTVLSLLWFVSSQMMNIYCRPSLSIAR